MPGMKAWLALSLASFLPAVGASAAVGRAASADTVIIHRCVDAKGRVTLQDEPCPKGSRDTARALTRPRDPPPAPAAPAGSPAEVVRPALPVDEAPPRELIPPPPMYRCTSYDGIERYSEQYDPNPRCEPYVLYYPYPNNLTQQQALACRWVEDSCVRLSDGAACARWKAMRKEAASALLRAFSDTAAYRKSELARLSQIVDDSCP